MQTTKNKRLNSKGFTLIELLIVIIIIGILAAIAFIAYNGSQTKAHQATAQETVSQARNKLGEYNADNGNYPDSQATFTTWLNDTTSNGGASPSLGASFTAAKGYAYAATPASCSGAACTGYTITATAATFGGSADITATN